MSVATPTWGTWGLTEGSAQGAIPSPEAGIFSICDAFAAASALALSFLARNNNAVEAVKAWMGCGRHNASHAINKAIRKSNRKLKNTSDR